jgi:NAD(P)-dependent dehydrogenase (short-subunit alcohol dehydrogenase family)
VSDLFSIEGKTALVTGGSRGIGLMIARGFVEAGARVYISSRKQAVCDEVAAELSKLGSCTSLPANLSEEAECLRLASEIGSREPARTGGPPSRTIPPRAGTACSIST